MGEDSQGQASSEYIILLGAMMITLLVALGAFWLAPNFASDVQQQKSDTYWADSRPFSVQSNTIYTAGMLLQVQNTEPVTMTITGVSLNGVPLNFYNHSANFTWGRTADCSSGVCSLQVRPGQTLAISTENFSASPPQSLPVRKQLFGRQSLLHELHDKLHLPKRAELRADRGSKPDGKVLKRNSEPVQQPSPLRPGYGSVLRLEQIHGCEPGVLRADDLHARSKPVLHGCEP